GACSAAGAVRRPTRRREHGAPACRTGARTRRAQARYRAHAFRPVPPIQTVNGWTPIDCHAHTTMSDGALSIGELIEAVREKGARPSVADHLSTDVSQAVKTIEGVREYLDALEPYDVARGGEFCWHDPLWRELRDDLSARFTHKLGSLHAVHIPGVSRPLSMWHRELPNELTPATYMTLHLDELERFAAEMP